MTVEQADKQSANPKYVPQYIPNEKGKWRGLNGRRYEKNPAYKKSHVCYSINCQTCTPAYALRLMGFNVTAKGWKKGSKMEYLSSGTYTWDIWKNCDGTPAKYTSARDWLSKNGYAKMTWQRWLDFFDDACKDEGVYALCIGWKRGGGHMTVLQRFADDTLRYIEPQHDNSTGSGYEWKNLAYLAQEGSPRQADCRGIMRIDNKLFNTDFAEIFDIKADKVKNR